MKKVLLCGLLVVVSFSLVVVFTRGEADCEGEIETDIDGRICVTETSPDGGALHIKQADLPSVGPHGGLVGADGQHGLVPAVSARRLDIEHRSETTSEH